MKTIVQLVSELKDYFLNKDTEAKQAVEANIAPVEINALSSSSAYAIGAQLILNDVLYDVTSSISVGDAITVGTNITPASKLSANIKSKQDQIEVTTMPTASASNVGKVYIYIGATTSSLTSGHSYQSTLESGSYVWKDVSGGSPSADAVSYDGTSSDLEATNVQDAIDELHNNIGSVVSAELRASITTISFDVPTTGNHLIDFWISDGSNFTQIDTSTSGRVTLTFNASAINRTVSMRIANI